MPAFGSLLLPTRPVDDLTSNPMPCLAYLRPTPRRSPRRPPRCAHSISDCCRPASVYPPLRSLYIRLVAGRSVIIGAWDGKFRITAATGLHGQ